MSQPYKMTCAKSDFANMCESTHDVSLSDDKSLSTFMDIMFPTKKNEQQATPDQTETQLEQVFMETRDEIDPAIYQYAEQNLQLPATKHVPEEKPCVQIPQIIVSESEVEQSEILQNENKKAPKTQNRKRTNEEAKQSEAPVAPKVRGRPKTGNGTTEDYIAHCDQKIAEFEKQMKDCNNHGDYNT